MKGLAKFVGVLACMAITAVYGGLVFSYLWGWFATPFGLPAIHIAWAIGIMLLIRSRYPSEKESTFTALLEETYTSLVHSSLIWLMGYICSFWM
jgi:uncharacterized protein (DUF2062 family)